MDVKDWLWLVQTEKGDFFFTVTGKYTQGEAAKMVMAIFKELLKIAIIGLIPRKRPPHPDDPSSCTIHQNHDPDDPHEFYLLAGKRLWEVCGRGAEYEAEYILLSKQMKEEGL